MHAQKFDYYSADHARGGSTCFKCITFNGENPTSACIHACKLSLGLAMRDRPAVFVQQRECFQLPFIASPCNLPSLRYSLLEITLSFQNAQFVSLLVSRPLCKGLLLVMTGYRGSEQSAMAVVVAFECL